mmetsp:Transcript_56999/g.130880  ORF Transcript_56999/g.130880 Transcript_56999/m.130880 type:complete len:226 (-) Transcript_56999:725-1402(-)
MDGRLCCECRRGDRAHIDCHVPHAALNACAGCGAADRLHGAHCPLRAGARRAREACAHRLVLHAADLLGRCARLFLGATERRDSEREGFAGRLLPPALRHFHAVERSTRLRVARRMEDATQVGVPAFGRFAHHLLLSGHHCGCVRRLLAALFQDRDGRYTDAAAWQPRAHLQLDHVGGGCWADHLRAAADVLAQHDAGERRRDDHRLHLHHRHDHRHDLRRRAAL